MPELRPRNIKHHIKSQVNLHRARHHHQVILQGPQLEAKRPISHEVEYPQLREVLQADVSPAILATPQVLQLDPVSNIEVNKGLLAGHRSAGQPGRAYPGRQEIVGRLLAGVCQGVGGESCVLPVEAVSVLLTCQHAALRFRHPEKFEEVLA